MNLLRWDRERVLLDLVRSRPRGAEGTPLSSSLLFQYDCCHANVDVYNHTRPTITSAFGLVLHL